MTIDGFAAASGLTGRIRQELMLERRQLSPREREMFGNMTIVLERESNLQIA